MTGVNPISQTTAPTGATGSHGEADPFQPAVKYGLSEDVFEHSGASGGHGEGGSWLQKLKENILAIPKDVIALPGLMWRRFFGPIHPENNHGGDLSNDMDTSFVDPNVEAARNSPDNPFMSKRGVLSANIDDEMTPGMMGHSEPSASLH